MMMCLDLSFLYLKSCDNDSYMKKQYHCVISNFKTRKNTLENVDSRTTERVAINAVEMCLDLPFVRLCVVLTF